jgi:Flp pilus assembly pilin Flp
MKLRPSRLTRIRTRIAHDELGTTTAEYALGTLAACAFAVVLYKLVTGGTVSAALSALLHRALSLAG